MIKLFSSFKTSLVLFLAVLGPGIIAAVADNDAAGVATYSIIGANFGYSMLFLLLLITVLLAVTQEIGARLTIVTGKGLADLIREQYGIRIAIVVFIFLFMANLGTTIADFAGLSASLRLFHFPIIPSLIGIIGLIVLFIYKGDYKTNQRIFLLSIFLYMSYVVSAVLAHPDWNKAFTSLVSPQDIKFSSVYIFSAIALLGTTVTPWGQFFISSFINDKKITVENLKFEQIEVYFGAFITNFFSFFMIVAVAATLFTNGIKIQGAADAALAIKPFAGQFAFVLFGFGLFAAGFMGSVIIPLSTAYAFTEFFGIEGSLDAPVNKSKAFYILFLLQIIIAFFVVLIPHVSLFKIALYSQSLNGILLPVIILFLLKFANDKELMGKHVNNKFYNYFAIISGIIILIASLFVIIGGILGKL